MASATKCRWKKSKPKKARRFRATPTHPEADPHLDKLESESDLWGITCSYV